MALILPANGAVCPQQKFSSGPNIESAISNLLQNYLKQWSRATLCIEVRQEVSVKLSQKSGHSACRTCHPAAIFKVCPKSLSFSGMSSPLWLLYIWASRFPDQPRLCILSLGCSYCTWFSKTCHCLWFPHWKPISHFPSLLLLEASRAS